MKLQILIKYTTKFQDLLQCGNQMWHWHKYKHVYQWYQWYRIEIQK